MPEGPEIRRAADGIERALVGRRASVVSFGLARLAPWSTELQGQTVTAVETRGKALLTRFSNGLSVYSHNQLYGKWFVRRAGNYPATGRSLRLEIRNEEQAALLYSASDIAVLEPSEESAHPFLARLGPDALDAQVDEDVLVEHMQARPYFRRNLGGLLLDQGFVAGLGNYLRSEILWWAGLHPSTRPADLEPEDRRQLAHWILDVTRQSYRHAGVTNCLARAAEGKAAGLPRRAWRHAVFGRVGQPCPECGAAVENLPVASRRLHLCPACQPAAT